MEFLPGQIGNEKKNIFIEVMIIFNVKSINWFVYICF